MKDNLKIFLVDDDADEAELLRDAVASVTKGVIFQSFTTGERALNHIIVEKHIPDLIFLDLNLPIQSGKEILKKLREEEISSNIPVVIYSTTILDRDIEETRHYTVKHYLQKPANFKILCNSVSEILEG